jgi:hypothetical protein
MLQKLTFLLKMLLIFAKPRKKFVPPKKAKIA